MSACAMDTDDRSRLIQVLRKLNICNDGSPNPDWASPDRFNDPIAVMAYVNANVQSLTDLWSSVEANFDYYRRASCKDETTARVARREAKFLLDQLKKEEDSAAKKRGLKEVLKLVDEALINTPVPHMTLATLYAIRAQALFQSKEYELALVSIDQAILLAPTAVKHIITKSKFLASLGKFRDALDLITKAQFELDYPRMAEESGDLCRHELLMQKLEEAKVDLEASLQGTHNFHKADIGDHLEEKPNSSASIKNFSVDYRLQLNEARPDKGRAMFASEPIPADRLVFKEKFTSLVIYPGAHLCRCNNCGRDVTNRFIPCRACNQVVYCAETCAQSDWNQSHHFDCCFLAYWTGTSKSMSHVFKQLNRLGVHRVLKLIAEAKHLLGAKYDLANYMNDRDQRMTKETDKSSEMLENAFKAQMGLMSHAKKAPISHLAQHLVNAIECAFTACLAQDIAFTDLSQEQFITLIAYCFTSVRRVLINSFRWTESADSNDSNDRYDVASVTCLLGALFNHSCQPNCDWTIKNGTLYLFTHRAIRAGEELTISYGPREGDPIEDRQTRLFSGYYFFCNCPCCVKDSRSELALQCLYCQGPVLANLVENYFETAGANCLLCSKPLPGSHEKLAELRQCRKQLDIATKLLISANKSNLYNEHFESLKHCMSRIQKLIYHKANDLIEDCYKMAQLLATQDKLEECIPYGAHVDGIMSTKTSGLFVITRSNAMSSDEDSRLDVNIEHLQFWTGIYRLWILKSHSKDPALWSQMIRFYYRLDRLLSYAFSRASKKIAKLESKKKASSCPENALRRQTELLATLKKHKQDELALLKEAME